MTRAAMAMKADSFKIEDREVSGVNATLRVSGKRWYVAHTVSHREQFAAVNLRRQGFRVFLPLRLKNRRHARKVETVRVPLFPRYVFISMDPHCHRWRCVNGTFGVSRLIMEGERPKPVPPGIVEAMRAQADANGVMAASAFDGLAIGRPAEILAGPFADQIGVLERLDDDGRVRLLLDIMGGRVSIDVPREFVTSVN